MDHKECETITLNQAEHWYYRAKLGLLLKILGTQQIDEMVDVGAGSAYFARELLRSGRIRTAWCVDIEYPVESTERIGQSGTLHSTPRSPNVLADGLLMMDVLEHVDDDLGLLKDSVNLLRPRGTVIITVPAFGWLWSKHDDFLGHRRRYTVQSVDRLTRGAGLVEQQCFYYYSLVFPLAAISRLLERLVRNPESKSQLQSHGTRANAFLRRLCSFELRYARRNRLFGLSVVCIARRP